jgi:hypothetical protein
MNVNANMVVVILIALIVGIILGALAIYLTQQARTRRLKERFGPEYSRVVAETGNRSRAEATLEHRRKRVEQLQIRTLQPGERAHFQEGWREVQGRFVDNPSGALSEADRLISEVMSIEGYPMQNFEQRAADVSVDHPWVIENYRGAHEIALRNAQGNATTEELRKAMLHYRTLFEELVGHAELPQAERIRL